MNKENIPVRGVAPENDPGALAERQRAIKLLHSIMDAKKPHYLDLVPEPDNEYDPDAIAVYTTIYGVRQQLGYLPRDTAYEISHTLEKHFGVVQQIIGGEQGKYWGIRISIRQRRV